MRHQVFNNLPVFPTKYQNDHFEIRARRYYLNSTSAGLHTIGISLKLITLKTKISKCLISHGNYLKLFCIISLRSGAVTQLTASATRTRIYGCFPRASSRFETNPFRSLATRSSWRGKEHKRCEIRCNDRRYTWLTNLTEAAGTRSRAPYIIYACRC